MKLSKTLISAILLLLAVNTQFLWEGKLWVFTLLVYLLLFVCSIVLLVRLIKKVYRLIKGTDRTKQNVVECLVMAASLGLIVAYPWGIVRFPNVGAPIKLKAFHEAAGGCGSTLYLREDGSFVERSVCFGILDRKGTYRISHDTIYFSSDDYPFDYAVMDSATIRVHRKGATGDHVIPFPFYIIRKD